MREKQTNNDFNIEYEDGILHLNGEFDVNNSSYFHKKANKLIEKITVEKIKINVSNITKIDSIGITSVFLFQENLKKKGIKSDIINASDNFKTNLKLFELYDEIEPVVQTKKGMPEKLGESTNIFIKDVLRKFIILAADIFFWTFADVFASKNRRKGEVKNQANLIGANAVLIVSVMSFIIGLVLAVQSASQLRNFGADIFIVDLTVISVMSEMGPLITAILVAGRSGSAIAAEIATMRVTNELDALQTMSLNPIRFVVVPKIYAGFLTMPFLTMFANVAGIAGGMTAAYFYLGITPEVFFNRISDAYRSIDLITGLIKSFVFITLIIITGSFYGLRVDRGAEGVGKVTTKSVVVSISLVIITDSLIGLLFY